MRLRPPHVRLPRSAIPFYARWVAIACGLASTLLFALLIESRYGGLAVPLVPPQWTPVAVLLACAFGLTGIFIAGVRAVLLPPLLSELEALRQDALAYHQAAALTRLAGSALADGHHHISRLVDQGAHLLNPIRTPEESRADSPSRRQQGSLSPPELTWLVLGDPAERNPNAHLPLALNELIRDLVRQLPRLLGPRIQVATHLDPALPPIHGDPGQLHQVLLNLALNAGDAMPRGGRLEIATRPLFLPDDNAEHLPPGRYIEVAVSDNGIGIPDDMADKVFDPFFTTKPGNAGSGLGLAMVRALVENHGGCVDLFTQEEHGTTFTLIFPVASEKASSRGATSASRMVGGSATILVVDEDAVVCKTVQKILEHAGYNSIATDDAGEALRLFRLHHTSIDLVLLDLSSPAINGHSLCEEMCAISRSVRFLFSGDRGATALPDHTRGPVGFLKKPYHIRQMTEAIRKVLDRQS